MAEDILKQGDAIINIPDADAYWGIYERLKELGYEVWSGQTKGHFEEFPNVIRDSNRVSAGTNMWKSKRNIDYYDFIIMIGGVGEEYNGDWRDKLSDEFNKKIQSYDEPRVDSQG